MNDRNTRLKRMFRAEGRAMLAKLGNVLQQIQDGGGVAEDVNRAFRYAHSLKSEAAFLEHNELASRAHELEERLAALRKGDTRRDGLVSLLVEIEALFAAAVEQISAEIDAPEPDPTVAVKHEQAPEVLPRAARAAPARRAESLSERLTTHARRAMLEARKRNERLYHIRCRITSAGETRYPRAFLVLNNLELRSNVILAEPDIDRLSDSADGSLEILVSSPGGQDPLREALTLDEVESVQIVEEEYSRYLATPQECFRPSLWQENVTLKIKTRLYEELCLFVDEMWLQAHGLRSLADAEEDERAAGDLDRLRFLADQVRTRIGATSTVELIDLFGDLAARVRSYGEERGKKVRFEVAGGSGPVYVPLAELLVEALLHLVRNAIDHGIESPEQREAKGKHAEGRIHVNVERRRNELRLIVGDDGRGVDDAALRRVGGEQPLIDLLAQPGFTTAKTVDQESGRGVGLDAVAHTIRESLGGALHAENRPGRGFSIVMSVPNVGRTYSVLIVGARGRHVALPAASIVDYAALDRRRVRRDSLGNRYYAYEGDSLQLIELEGSSTSDPEASVVILSVGQARGALVVQSVRGEETVVREMSRPSTVFSHTTGSEVALLLPMDLLSLR